MSCQRPVRRRRLRVRRPPRELMRERKPWTRARLIRDFGRRFFFMGLRYYIDAAGRNQGQTWEKALEVVLLNWYNLALGRRIGPGACPC